MNNNKLLIGFILIFISFNVNAHVIDLPNDYILTYEKISNTDNCLIDCSLKFRIKLNKDYLIQQNSFITKKFKNYIGNLDIDKSGFRIRTIEEYQYKDYNKPIYGEVEKQKLCNGIQGTNFGTIDINTGWCNDSLCLMNSTNCYYEHEYNTYKLIGNGAIFFYSVNEIIDYNYSIRNKEVWNKFNSVGKTIKKDSWYYLELWGKRLPSIDEKSAFINISLMGKFLGGLSWWNSSYQHKRLINCSNMNDKIPIIVNGSSGFSISGNTQLVWSYCSGSGTALYYNNYTDYVIANDTDRLPMEVEKGNGTNYNSVKVWNNHKTVLHFPENTGTNTDESTINDHDGTLGSTNLWDSGMFGYGVADFNTYTTNVGLTHTYSTLLSGSNDFSIEVWAYPDSMHLGNIWGFRGEREVEMLFYVTSSKCQALIKLGGVWKTLKNSTGFTLNSWNHFVFTYSSSTGSKLYFNTVLKDSDATVGTVNTGANNNRLGQHSGANSQYWDGHIDEFRVWNKTLTATEINKTYYNVNNSNGYGNLESLQSSNYPPVISNPYPPNNSTNISFNPMLNITVNDADNDTMNVSFYNSSNHNVICINNSISNGTILYCKWNTVSNYNTTYYWYVNATDNYTTTKSSIYNFTTHESATTTIISEEGLINIRVIDLTDSQYTEILIYQNDNTSTKYIMTKNLSKPFKVCQNVSYSFIVIPKSISIIRNVDNYFLDYLLGNIYLLAFIFTLVSIIGYLIFKK